MYFGRFMNASYSENSGSTYRRGNKPKKLGQFVFLDNVTSFCVARFYAKRFPDSPRFSPINLFGPTDAQEVMPYTERK